MFQCLFAFLNEIVPFSISSMAFSNVSLVHLPLVIKGLHLLTLLCFLVGFCPKDGGHFPCLVWFLLQSTLPPTRYINHHDVDPPGPNLQHIGGVLSSLTRDINLNFLYFAQLSRKYDKSRYV
jgi:hypothetical protein